MRLMMKGYSQAGQDIFVLLCTDYKKDGIFLDLGCNDPIFHNNTYLLEKDFNWRGLSVDIDAAMIQKFNVRKTPATHQDCTKLDFKTVYEICGPRIDYLSLDLDDVTYNCLCKIPFTEIEFSIITYEHDLYRVGPEHKNKAIDYLASYGYKLVCSNVSVDGYGMFEDWYYNPKYINYDHIKVFESDSMRWQDILQKSSCTP
jgi:hypothetical protein